MSSNRVFHHFLPNPDPLNVNAGRVRPQPLNIKCCMNLPGFSRKLQIVEKLEYLLYCGVAKKFRHIICGNAFFHHKRQTTYYLLGHHGFRIRKHFCSSFLQTIQKYPSTNKTGFKLFWNEDASKLQGALQWGIFGPFFSKPHPRNLLRIRWINVQWHIQVLREGTKLFFSKKKKVTEIKQSKTIKQ